MLVEIYKLSPVLLRTSLPAVPFPLLILLLLPHPLFNIYVFLIQNWHFGVIDFLDASVLQYKFYYLPAPLWCVGETALFFCT